MDEAIGRRVAQFRGDTPQTDLARHVNALGGKLTQQHLSQLETGKSRWNSDNLYWVARALGVRMADLMPDAPTMAASDEVTVALKPHEWKTVRLLRQRGGVKLALQHLAGLLPDGP